MAYMSDDRTVVPSFLGIEPVTTDYAPHLDHPGIYLGEVKAVYPVSHEKNRSGKYTEYLIEITFGGTVRQFIGFSPLDVLGGMADQIRYTYRASVGDQEDPEPGQSTVASRVLVAFIGNDLTAPFILGGIPHRRSGIDHEPGHHFSFSFNGTKFLINDAGELKLQVKGATNADGTPREDVDDDMGATIDFTKKGDITIQTSDGKEKVLIERSTGNIQIATENEHEHITLDRSDGKVKIDGQDGTHIGTATDFQLLGESYRKAQNSLNTTLRNEIQHTMTHLTAAIGLLATPVVGGALAAPELTLVVESLLQMYGAILRFESPQGAKKYISKKNKVG